RRDCVRAATPPRWTRSRTIRRTTPTRPTRPCTTIVTTTKHSRPPGPRRRSRKPSTIPAAGGPWCWFSSWSLRSLPVAATTSGANTSTTSTTSAPPRTVGPWPSTGGSTPTSRASNCRRSTRPPTSSWTPWTRATVTASRTPFRSTTSTTPIPGWRTCGRTWERTSLTPKAPTTRNRGDPMSTADPQAPTKSPEAPTELPPVKRRNAELTLICVTIVITMAAIAISGLNLDGQIPGAMWGYGLTFGAMALATHVALRFIAPYADPLILPCALFLNGIGVAMIWRLDAAESGDIEHAGVGMQLIWTAIGMVLCIALLFFLREPRVLQRYTYISALSAIILIALPMLPVIGISEYGARRWIG